MEIDLIRDNIDFSNFSPRDVEEAFEDPFAVRFLPSADSDSGPTRYYALGSTFSGRYLMLVFWSDGSRIRVIYAREMEDNERRFYERKYAESV